MKTLKLDYGDKLPVNYTGIIEYVFGTTCYYLNGKYHREDGPAVIYPDGTLHYYLNGELHREDGPAIIYPGGNIYYLNGKCHREDGPAIIITDGTIKYYLNDKEITNEVDDWLSGKTDITPYEKWNNSDRLIFKLTY